MKKRNYVYLIGSSGGPPYKVGHATNPEQRMASFLAGSPETLAVLQKWKRDGDAGVIERLAHKKLDAFRVRSRREWFSSSLDETREAIEAAIDETDNPRPKPKQKSLLDLAKELRERNELEAAEAVLELHQRKEARRLVAKIGGDAAAKAAAERRERNAEKARQIQRMWLDKTVPTDEVVKRTGMSRDTLYNQFGARGLPRFVGVKKEPT